MKPRIGLLLALAHGAGIVAAATTPDISEYPPCAVGCIIKALPESPCTGMNQTCLCADPVFSNSVGGCLKTGCTVKEQLSAANLTWSNCGFPLTDNTNLPRILTGTLFVLPTAFIVLRMVNKFVNPSPWGADDISILLGFILFVTQIFYISGLFLIKASIIFFYLRIFPSARFRRVLWATQGINVLLAILYLVLTFTQCEPLPLYWTGWDGQQADACRDFNKLVLSHTGLNIAFDVWMLALPLTQLYKLNLRPRKKIGVMVMFSVGIFLTAVSVIRIQTLINFAATNNITSEALWVYVWSHIEFCVGVAVACMPSASQVWRSASTQIKSLSSTSSTQAGSRSSAFVVPSPKRKTVSQDVFLGSIDSPTAPAV